MLNSCGGTVETSKSYLGKGPCEAIIAGDINSNCAVDFEDWALMALRRLEANSPWNLRFHRE